MVMLSISVSGSANCAGCAYEATEDFGIYFLISKYNREIVGCFISIHKIRFETETDSC